MSDYFTFRANQLLERATNVGTCLECHLYRDKDGYAQMSGGEYVHRFIYRIKVGDIGKLQVLHRCDNPSCINPQHLFLGTQADNMKDMITKGRRADTTGFNRSVKNPQEIVDLYNTGLYSQAELARKFKVHASTINNIIHGTKGYKDVVR